jgi:hypothetical protein
MLSILVLGLAKLSLIFVLSALTPVKRMLWTFRIVAIFIAIWVVSSVLATSFQCKLPEPWKPDSGRCIDQASHNDLYRPLAHVLPGLTSPCKRNHQYSL